MIHRSMKSSIHQALPQYLLCISGSYRWVGHVAGEASVPEAWPSSGTLVGELRTLKQKLRKKHGKHVRFAWIYDGCCDLESGIIWI